MASETFTIGELAQRVTGGNERTMEIQELNAELKTVQDKTRRDQILFRLVELGAGYWVDCIDGGVVYWPIPYEYRGPARQPAPDCDYRIRR